MNEQLSVALLVDGPRLQGWERRVVDHLLANGDAEISAILVDNTDGGEFSLEEVLSDLSLWMLYGAHRRALWALTEKPWYRQFHQLPGTGTANTLHVDPRPAADIGQELPPDAVAELERHDLAVRFGFGILKGEALTAPTYGVLSFHHGDLRTYRGRPAGFWELLNDESEVGITVQRLSETLDGGEIAAFETVDITNTNSWPAVLDQLFRASEPLLTRAVDRLVAGPGVERPDQLGTLYSTPGWRETLRYLSRRITSSLR